MNSQLARRGLTPAASPAAVPASPVPPPAASNAPHDLLGLLAMRVRAGRARLAMTRRTLAEVSGVSERHLAQVESGNGNISVSLLGRVAEALQMSMADLFRESTQRSAEIELIDEVLHRLPEGTLVQLRKQLMRDHGRLQERRRDRIALIGLRGGGKSTLGAALARRMATPFVELDREIEGTAGTSLSEIFMLYGQTGYRRYEKQSLDSVLRQHDRVVIATGGSLVTEAATYDLLLASCFTIWIKAAPEEHMARVVAQGDLRPMEGNDQSMMDLQRILEARDALYRRADAIIDTRGRTPDESLRDLIKLLRL